MRLTYAPVTAVLLLVSFWCGSLAPSSTTILGPAASCCGAAAGAGSRVAAACFQRGAVFACLVRVDAQNIEA
jgi:hypothetical protein